jgi:hypothetical protein
MKKIISLLMLTCLSSNAFAGHFYNIEDESQLKSASQVNYVHRTGFSDNLHQITLIGPRLAVGARHGLLGGEERAQNTPISFYGKQYRIIRAIEHPALKPDAPYDLNLLNASDLTVFVLDQDVIHPDGGAVACPLTLLDHTKPLPPTEDPLYAHSMSQSPKIRLNNFHTKFENTDFSNLYGKTRLSSTYFLPSDRYFDNGAQITTQTDHENTDQSLMVPVMGDSGSPLYMPLKNGGYTLIGVMSRIHDEDTDPFGYGQYTPTAKNIEWLRSVEKKLIDDGVLENYAGKEFKVVTQDEWDFEAHTPVEIEPALRISSPMDYLALNPDLVKEWSWLPFEDALKEAMWHRDTFAAQEGRRTYLSQGEGDPALGTKELANPAVYLALNNDLQVHFGKNATLQQALDAAMGHFQTSAKAELRRVSLDNTKHRPDVITLPYDFSPKGYLRLNPDVVLEAEMKNVDPLEFAKLHYKNIGFKDKNKRYTLRIPHDFRHHYFMYFALNPDLKILMNGKESGDAIREGSRHYTTVGFLEDLTYKYEPLEKRAPMGEAFTMPDDFDAALYLALNTDLIRHYERESDNNITYDELLQKGTEHYRNHGGPEDGRRYR